MRSRWRLATLPTFSRLKTWLAELLHSPIWLSIMQSADWIETLTPGAEPRGFAAIALGKHGSRELNYSSDIDPILIFDPETLPHRQRDEPAEAAVRIATRMMQTMQARDGDGYVFRVDLRLRPNPEVTPIALPVEAGSSYYKSSALAWERAAFIRARACSGDVALGQGFLDVIKPFIWRRGLDFGAISRSGHVAADPRPLCRWAGVRARVRSEAPERGGFANANSLPRSAS